ncbi:unnamed protein product [Leptidea sinapis]|uniref:RNA helicase n=1 Tax=Leptidea sinapis TaxID=189913 RepID=A0A5E4QJB9_9NEOP|nr:unnamed protein product [Leptidea sinapis]
MENYEESDFVKLGVKPWLIKQLATLGIRTPTPIQKGCISQILQGYDCIGAAKTGSGKTFAFALPILQHLAEDPFGIFALVLTPTHELAYQIADQFSILGQPLKLRVCIVTGGSDQLEESLKLAKRPHITIFGALSANHQNLLFSATITEDVRNSKYLSLNKEKLTTWSETDTQLTVSTLDQRYVVCPAYARDVYLVQTLRKYRETKPSSHVIVFTDTKK